MSVTVASLAAALIQVFEGLKLTAYRDSGGVATVGFGTTQGIHLGMTITYDQAVAWLERDSQPLFALVKGKPLQEAAALVSFGYNCGAGALERVLKGESELSQFVHDRHGNVLQGLVSRRNLEQQLIDLSRETQ